MKEIHVDVAVIGAGSAGLSAYRAARKRSARVVLIESGQYGTTCARHACMPSKLLIAAANALHESTLLEGFGIELTTPPRVHGGRVLQRVRHERDRFVGLVVDEVEAYPPEDRLRGTARFLADQVLEVTLKAGADDKANGREGVNGAETDERITIHARSSVIATGAGAVIPDAYRTLGKLLQTSDDVFEWPDLPETVAVVGTGVIAVELGQALARLGVKVTMFGKGPSGENGKEGKSNGIAAITDPAVADEALRLFRREFDIHMNPSVKAHGGADGRAIFQFTDDNGQPHEQIFDRVLLATGRAPRLDDLSLVNTSLKLDEKGVPLFDGDTLQCAHAPIFIAGDANQQRPWLNDAANEGRIAGEGAADWPNARPQTRPEVLSIVFSDPGVLMVGRAWASLDEQRVVVGEINFKNQGRARVTQRNAGLLRVYADSRSGRLLGAEGVAPAGEHLAHLLAWAVQQELTLNTMLDMPFYHPVFEEGLRTALRDAAKQRTEVLKAAGEADTIDRPGATPSLSDAVGT